MEADDNDELGNSLSAVTLVIGVYLKTKLNDELKSGQVSVELARERFCHDI